MKQKGFTAVEMVFVIAVVGVVAAVVAPAISGNQDAVKAQRLMKAATDIENTVNTFVNEAGSNTVIQNLGSNLYFEYNIMDTQIISLVVSGKIVDPGALLGGSPVPSALINTYNRAELGPVSGISNHYDEFGANNIKITGFEDTAVYLRQNSVFSCASGASYSTIDFYDTNGSSMSQGIALNVMQKAGSALSDLPVAGGSEVCLKQGRWIYVSYVDEGVTYRDLYYILKENSI